MGNDSGSAYPGDGEGPVRSVTVEAFSIAPTVVTNEQFATFVDTTGHQTIAERDGWSFVFAGLLPDDFEDTRGVVGAEWWRQVFGASWRHPEGPQSEISDRLDHPVVHVSWFDAVAYADWMDARLPSEAEWEYAARGGLDGARLPWGDELLTAEGRHRCNIWTGQFPTHNDSADGWVGTAPADAFEPNAWGLYNCSGNVWEWTADWFTTNHEVGPPPLGTSRVVKGGSYLCHDSYCHRYRIAARSSNTPDSSTGHQGFRIAR